MGVSFDHTLCDGRGAAQFLKGVAEIARGEAGLSKPQQHSHLIRFQHDELLESGFVVNPNCSIPNVNAEELTLASFLLNSDALQRIKQPIAEELKENCTTFEVLAALAWRARTRALGIPLDQAVRLLFAVDVRRAFEPPLAEGYYGNGACPEITDVRMCIEDLYLTDWRWLGFSQVDFGWGEPLMACPISLLRTLPCPIAFVLAPKNKSGVKMVVCVPRSALKALETEIWSVVNR